MDTQIQALPATQTKVAEAGPDHINQQIERDTEARINHFKRQNSQAIHARIDELEREWDTGKVLKAALAGIALSSSLLALTTNQKWALLSGTASAFMLQYTLQGWCPPLSLIRRKGVRTPNEIQLEIQALRNLLKDEHYPL
ncbi:hypothetical protein QOZ98_000159 [Planomicrobium stackebrandtii]|uniref:DUF2892 domain-containing protein n=1 Tax=Planomicrobium stackebrandtii TaxID=253160 RepID=A0ABU0GPQ1_9BACL|nr:DUF2892 domain-containing protein [Planomicrobium stackebrandtii]MDQ0427334.1 hypothetical protein [Planomicrobium stackebrandtii]